jgi:hypothetical protein
LIRRAGFIAYLWLLNGAVNSNAYILAPRQVTPRQKPTAAGMLAMIYQLAHVRPAANACLTCVPRTPWPTTGPTISPHLSVG